MKQYDKQNNKKLSDMKHVLFKFLWLSRREYEELGNSDN